MNSFKVVIRRFVPPKKRMKGKKQLYPSFCNLILQIWLVKLILKSLKMIREITGNPEIIFPPTPQHRKIKINESRCRPAGWPQKPAVVFVRAPGMDPWKSVFDLFTRLTSYIYIGVIIHLLSTMEIHEHASSLPGWAGWFFQILNFF